jgi:3-vinyl bacteriochlorophyllide hydratase
MARTTRTTPLYTPEQRRRRDASRWTVVQGVLAPLQLLVCIGSAILVARYLTTGAGWGLASLSVLLKTLLLYLIMVTGAIWEHDVFGQYLFAPAFFWEDVVSFGVLRSTPPISRRGPSAGWSRRTLATLALVAYAAYSINAAQFLWKLRIARRDAKRLR